MAKTIRRIRESVQKIAKRAGLTEAQARVAADVVQGVSQSGSCHLSEIGRALGKDEPLMTTESRLSKSLARPSFDPKAMADTYLADAAQVAKRMPFVAVDPTDLVKPYGRVFEHLDHVRDASDRRKHVEPGYWAIRIEALNEGNDTLPLYTEVFSTKAPDYTDWNDMFFAAVKRVHAELDNDATWIFDRAFDGLEWMKRCQQLGLHWLIRQQETRRIEVATGATYDMHVFASSLNRPHRVHIPYVDKKTHEIKFFTASFGYAPVRVPDLDADLYLIVVQRANRPALVLLTNIRITKTKQAARLVCAYMRRWGVEDGIRFWKQKTGIEDLRVRKWNSIRLLAMLSMVACGLQALMLLTRPSLARRFIDRVKVFIAIVPFRHYRLWDGVRDALLSEA